MTNAVFKHHIRYHSWLHLILNLTIRIYMVTLLGLETFSLSSNEIKLNNFIIKSALEMLIDYYVIIKYQSQKINTYSNSHQKVNLDFIPKRYYYNFRTFNWVSIIYSFISLKCTKIIYYIEGIFKCYIEDIYHCGSYVIIAWACKLKYEIFIRSCKSTISLCRKKCEWAALSDEFYFYVFLTKIQ